VRLGPPSSIEMNQLFKALDVAVVEKFLLEKGPRCLGGGHCRGVSATSRAVAVCIWPWVSGANRVHDALGLGADPKPLRRNVPSPRSPITKAAWIRRKAVKIRLGLVIERILRFERQSEVGIAKTREQRPCIRWSACVSLTRRQRGRQSVEVAGVAIAFTVKQLVTSHLIGRQGRLPG
jgi:hypothetical protein